MSKRTPVITGAWFAKAIPSGITHRVVVELDDRFAANETAVCGFIPRHGWFALQPTWWDAKATICTKCYFSTDAEEWRSEPRAAADREGV